MTSTFHRMRRLTGALLLGILIGLPFLRIGGESAFRFDIPTLRLLFFGTQIWLADFFIILIAVIFLTFFTLFATTVFGRVWCGWLCPQTVLVDATTFVDRAGKRGKAAVGAAWGAAAVISAVIAASLLGYFVSPYELPALLSAGGSPATLVSGTWMGLTVFLFLDLVALRRRFCATVCPYAKMQSVLFDDRTLVVSFDDRRAKECMQCDACVKACPVGIDIKKGVQMACIHCAECVDACTKRMAARDRASLVDYSFGIPGARKSGPRLNPLLTGALSVISLVFLFYLSASRMPFDMNVHLNYTGGPNVSADGSVTNSYELSLRNMGTIDLELTLKASAAGAGSVLVSPDALTLPKGQGILRRPVSVTFTGTAFAEQRPLTVTLTARAERIDKSIEKTVYFLLPKTE